MEEKDVAGIGLAPGRLSGQQGDLAMGRGMLGEIVEHHHRMAATIPKILGHREARERRDPLQPRRRGGARHDEDGAVRRAMPPHLVDHARDRRAFLADRDIDADHVAGALVDDRVDRERRLACGAVAENEFALPPADGEHRIDCERAGLHRLDDEVAFDDRRRRPFDRIEAPGPDRRAPIERTAERIDDSAKQCLANRHAHHLARAGYGVSCLHLCGIVEQHAANPVPVERVDDPVWPRAK
jgi:hypothetical protein